MAPYPNLNVAEQFRCTTLNPKHNFSSSSVVSFSKPRIRIVRSSKFSKFEELLVSESLYIYIRKLGFGFGVQGRSLRVSI